MVGYSPWGHRESDTTERLHFHFLSHDSKVMLKILQARLQRYMNREIEMFKLDLEKAEEPEIKLPTSIGSSKKQEISKKHLLLLY